MDANSQQQQQQNQLAASSPNTPSQPHLLATTSIHKNQRKLVSMMSKDTIECPAKRFKKHNRSLTVPALPVSRQQSDDSLTRVPQTSRPKLASVKTNIPLEKKSPPTVAPDLNCSGNSGVGGSGNDTLMQKDFKKLNEFQRTKRIKIMAEKISRVS